MDTHHARVLKEAAKAHAWKWCFAFTSPVLVESAPEFDSYYTAANKLETKTGSRIWFELRTKGVAVKVNKVKSLTKSLIAI